MHRDELPILEPCRADWDAMEPRGRARFCRECGIEVIDVSAYTEAEACELARRPRSGRVCMSYVVRADGTLRLADTPDVPVRSLFRKGRTLVMAASLALSACTPGEERGRSQLPIVDTEVRVAGEMPLLTAPLGVDAGTPSGGLGVLPREDHGRVQGGVQPVRVRGKVPVHPVADEPDQP